MCSRRSRLLRRSLLLIAAVSRLVGDDGAAAQATVAYPRDAGTVVASLTLTPGEADPGQPGLSVQVYGDGRAVVRRPPYFRDAGEYVARLSRGDVDALVAAMVEGGVSGFDAPAAMRAKSAAAGRRAAGGTLYIPPTDQPMVVMTLRTDRGEDTVRWTNLADDAERYPEIESLRKLAAIERRLQAITERPDLIKTK